MDRRKLRIFGMVAAAACVVGAIIACAVAYRHAAHERKAIYGEWKTINVYGNGASGDWRFSTNGYVDSPGGRSHCFINPIFHTISFGDGAHATYELDGTSMKIRQEDGDSHILWDLKKVRSY